MVPDGSPPLPGPRDLRVDGLPRPRPVDLDPERPLLQRAALGVPPPLPLPAEVELRPPPLDESEPRRAQVVRQGRVGREVVAPQLDLAPVGGDPRL